MNKENPNVPIILGVVDDLVGKLLWYDRRDCEHLPRGVIEETVQKGDLTVEEIVEAFSKPLAESLKGPR